jgi:hypothetical protein
LSSDEAAAFKRHAQLCASVIVPVRLTDGKAVDRQMTFLKLLPKRGHLAAD